MVIGIYLDKVKVTKDEFTATSHYVDGSMWWYQSCDDGVVWCYQSYDDRVGWMS